jgi:hypothetical protein
MFVCMLLMATVLPISADLVNSNVKKDSNVNSVDVSWYNTYGGEDKDGFYAVQQAPDGGYFAAGLTASSGAGSFDAWLVKTDSEGTLEWEKTFGGAGDDRFHRMEQISDGYLIVGQKDNDLFVVKVDSNGDEVWSKTYGGSENEIAWGGQQTADGGYILSGITESYAPEGIYHMWLIKTDENGTELWNKTYGEDDYFSECKGACQTVDGGYMLTGSIWPADQSDGPSGYLVKTDADGNVELEKSLEGAHWSVAVSITETTDDGFLISGSSSGRLFGLGGCMAWLIKTDADGNFAFNNEYGRKLISDTFWWAIQTDDGGYIGTGSRLGLGAFFNLKLAWFPYWSKTCVLKVDADGNSEWGATSPGNGVGRCIRQTNDDGYIVAGYTRNYPNFGDGILFKINSEGD